MAAGGGRGSGGCTARGCRAKVRCFALCLLLGAAWGRHTCRYPCTALIYLSEPRLSKLSCTVSPNSECTERSAPSDPLLAAILGKMRASGASAPSRNSLGSSLDVQAPSQQESLGRLSSYLQPPGSASMSLQPDIKTWLLPYDSLQLDKRIGQGAFGT